MSAANDWAGAGRRLAERPYAAGITGAVLVLGATSETLATAPNLRGNGISFALVLCLLAVVTTAPIALLRPLPAALLITPAVLLSLTVSHTLAVAGLLAQVVALFRLGRAGGPLLAVGLSLPFLVLALAGPPGVRTVLLATLAPAAAFAGIADRARGEASMHRTARQAIAESLVEHTARGERARIARELHDVVAHHISMIAVQAETARLTTPELPAAGARRLTEIGDTARAGLTEMRRLLGVLREDAAEPVAQRQPQPGLHQLNDLVDEARAAAGSVTRLIVSGPPADLDPGVELAAFRIVQEALTNARRHAPGAAVDVELRYTDTVLWLRIRDNGPGFRVPAPGLRADATEGHGLPGMRERAAAVGGTLRTGSAAVGGFLVEATLPATARVTA
ncbi:MAG TPA: sensor histidine kinase [Pseudonocardiaceae bacterium]|nr:sensor histidine kinase [Pseudonocardiaceae bacterium]